MTLSTAEIESVRFHLGYGNIAVDALPYTADGFWEMFSQIVSPYLSTGTETTATATITAGSVATVTPAAMTGIEPYCQLVIDTAEEAEVVSVKSVTSTTFTARFQRAHSSTFPIATMSGKARLRMLLHQADAVHVAMTEKATGDQQGIKAIVGEIEWFEGSDFSADWATHYRRVQSSISALVRVPIAQSSSAAGCRLEAY